MDNEQKIQEILSDAVEKLAAIDDNAAHQVSASLLVTRGALACGDLPTLSMILKAFAEAKISLYEQERDN